MMRAVPTDLDLIALHGLETGSPSTSRTIGVVQPAALNAAVQTRLISYVDNVWDRDSLSGRAVPGWWRDGQGPADLQAMLTADERAYLRESETAMARLAAKTPANAVNGLIAFLRTTDSQGATAMTCCKLEVVGYDDIQWRQSPGVTPAQALQQVLMRDMLPQAKKVQKAARIPGRSDADVWIVDEQIPDTAGYWLEFLNASRLPSERQRVMRVEAAVTKGLKDLGVADVATPVAKAIATAARNPSATLPETFARAAATEAGADAKALIKRLEETLPDALANPRFTVTQAAARDMTAKWDLGGGVTVAGPRGEIDERVEIAREKGKTYMKILATREPERSYSHR